MTDELSHLTGLPGPVAADDRTWLWAQERDAEVVTQVPPHQVMGVLVTHNGQEWLPRTLRALQGLTERPAMLVAVDAGSRDGSRGLLETAVEDGLVDHVVVAPAAGFGAAVAAALGAVEERHPWLWLLHDDAEPVPDALTMLLRTAATTAEPALLLPKILAPRRRNHPDRLLEIGQSISSGGARVLSVDPGDVDQHQVESGPVLGGSTAGMLVRREAWESLGGLDPDLPLFRDGLDLGWRAHDAGLIVLTVPEAGLRHHQAGRWGDRVSTGPGMGDLPALDRLTGLRLVAARSSRPALARVRLWATSLLTALVMLLGKYPADSAAAWRAGWMVLRDGPAIGRIRSRLEGRPTSPQAGLRPTPLARAGSILATGADAFTDRYRDLREDPGDTSLDDLIGDDFSGGRRRARLLAPTTAVLLALALACVVTGRSLLGRGQLVSTNLLPAPSSAADAFSAWLHPAAGHPGPNAPWLGLAAAGSWLTAGQPELLVRLLVVGAPLWAALAFLSLVRVVAGRAADGWLVGLLAATWGVVVAVLGLPQRGSVTAIAVAVLAPLAVSALLRWWAQDRPASDLATGPGELWRAPGLLALWLGLLGTAQPVFWLVALLVAIGHAMAVRRFSPRTVVVALGPILVSAPWWVRLADQPGRLLTAADPTTRLATAEASRPLTLAMGRLGDGSPPLVVSVVVFAVLWALAALVALVAWRRGRGLPTVLLSLALAGVAVGGLLAKAVVQVDGAQVRPLADSFVVVAALALLGCLVWAATRDQGGLRRVVTAASLVVVLVGAAGWQWSGGGGTAVVQSHLPAHVQGVQESPRASRALLVSFGPGQVGWNVSSDTSPQWGSGELHPGGDDGWSRQLDALVARVSTAGPPEDMARQLRFWGISHLWVEGATGEQLNALTNTEGLVASPVSPTATLFTVVGLVGRGALQTPRGDLVALPDATVAAGSQGAIVVAEPWDPRWRLSVGSQTLVTRPGRVTDLVDSPVPVSRVEADLAGQAGRLDWSIAPTVWAAIWEGLILLVLLVLAAPTLGRVRVSDGARFDEGAQR